MHTRRTRPLFVEQTAALIRESRLQAGQLTHAEAIAEVINLKRILSAERRRHSALEAALARYQQVLEAQITEQREAFLTLGKALRPEQPTRKAQQ